MFIDRKAELANLEARYASGQAELFVLYGRRRVGKTDFCVISVQTSRMSSSSPP